MILIAHIGVLIVAFYLLAEVSDRYFVISLDKISHRLKMSHDMAGATFMAIGSSAPELFVAVIALIKPGNHDAIGIGTIVGSALFNLLVIVGAAAMVKKSLIAWQPVVRDLIFYSIAILGLYYVLYNNNVVLLEAVGLILLYGVYVFSVFKWRDWFKYEEFDETPEDENSNDDEMKVGWKIIFRPLDWVLSKFFPPKEYYITIFFISIMLIASLCWVLVDSAIAISEILNIPEVVIALTVLAIGTSVPDMVSSVIVAKQGRAGMAVSNAIGSNIFDIFIGLGLPWLVKILVTREAIFFNIKGLDASVGLLFSSILLILFFLIWQKWRLSQNLGLTLIMLYILYILWEIFKVYMPNYFSTTPW